MTTRKSGALSICWLIATITWADISKDLAIQKATEYLVAGDYNQAITEYKRFLFFHPDHPQNSAIYLQMGKALVQLDDFQSAIDFFQIAIQQTDDLSLKVKISLELIPVLIADNQNDTAVFFCYQVLAHLDQLSTNVNSNDQAKTYFFLGVTEVYRQRWKAAKAALLISGLATPKVIELLDEFSNEEQKSARIAKWLSTLCPGLGQCYANKWIDGLNAFLLNGVLGSCVGYLFKSGQKQSAILLGSTLLWRYYNGNRHNAVKAARQHNEWQNEKKINHILDQLNVKKEIANYETKY